MGTHAEVPFWHDLRFRQLSEDFDRAGNYAEDI